MVDEVKLHRDAERARRAEKLLENELLQEAFESAEAALFKQWKNSQWVDTEVRENAYFVHCGLELIQEHIKGVARKGKSAETELHKLSEMRKREKKGS